MDECQICFGEGWVVYTPCRHLLCLNCLVKLRKDECPTCRRPLLNSLPVEIQGILTMNPKPAQGLNVNSHEDFPALG